MSGPDNRPCQEIASRCTGNALSAFRNVSPRVASVKLLCKNADFSTIRRFDVALQ